ncbi:hypothetical protein [Olleya sp. HaHaR_3_96]|uniref:hypothetical protein n=1 Tax=Olleya sp. HaHaR_3_96 TaxID=2745560 RepID=UPI001C4E5CC4|nr:hypothetical protein [Olleya sp. HaHaR_3_96]QXP60971.1 hypothetical protein H0I26_04860 [Olleya sp. HaHaR_3_96]
MTSNVSSFMPDYVPSAHFFKIFIVFVSLVFLQGCDSENNVPETTEEEVVVIEEPEEQIGDETNIISYYNDLIVFHFTESYTTGQYANGDYWVYNNGNDVVISDITPVSQNNGGRIINGAMINPENSENQGYDSESRDMGYDNTLNIDPGNTNVNLVVSAGSSIIKSISTASAEGRPIISDAAILTVVDEIPVEGAFRPPYTGTDKTAIATISDLDYNALGSYARLGLEPDIEDVSHYYDKVWLEHNTAWTSRDIHPANHMPAYGRDLANKSAIGLILLQLDYSNEEKEHLLINLVQYGIDIYGLTRTGTHWNNSGGHNLGRKMPLLLAAKVLNNTDMLSHADKEQHFIFQDDQQHFYVSTAEVAMTHSDAWDPDDRALPIPYEVSDIGMAEWGIHHADEPDEDNANWGATYRGVVGYAQTKHIFAARLMGVEVEWNWPAVFDYTDRFYDVEWEEGFDPYFVALWEAYR